MSMPTAIRAAVILSLAAPAALAQPFDGVYEYAFCDDPPYVALTIEGESVAFYETPCTLADAAPQAEPAGAVQYTMSCDHGSGPQASTVVLFFNPDGDLVLRSDGQEDRFVSCAEG
ncbi:MAG: hypothetical protein ACTS11_08760 [Roseicyclus sp.]